MSIKSFLCNLNKITWLNTIFWIVITAIITLIIEKSCDKIMPDSSMVIKETIDTVKIVHSYDLGIDKDSIIEHRLNNRIKNIALIQQYEEIVNKKVYNNNAVKNDVNFENKKGYVFKNAMAYFVYNISSIHDKIIDINMLFIDNEIVNEVYCLFISICKINDENRLVHFEEYYNVKGLENQILIVNNLSQGKYEFYIGFILEKDKNEIYPDVYGFNIPMRK